jgi:flap endonuclease-1|uniref:XPG N-terminal domain-containing protein n=1 Tax=viral metagenome TaxID=1070528 RepID=A0A6C0IN43_9ZZZZ
MGIRYLNTYIKNNCSHGLSNVNIRSLAGNSLAIDTSIYMYKYEMDNKLIENITRLVNLFIINRITPIFIFDGKPPEEKLQLLQIRRERRREASSQCQELLNKIETGDADEYDITKYHRLKQEATRITKDKVDSVKSLLTNLGVTYYTANGEADQLCASMVINGYCWGCVSDDMDMFVYGCKNIVRNVDIHNKTATVYKLDMILHELNISFVNFKQVCVMAGTDYNNEIDDNQSLNIYSAFKLYNRFTKKVKYDNMTFYDWLRHYIKYNVDYELLHKIYKMFEVKNEICIENNEENTFITQSNNILTNDCIVEYSYPTCS